MDPTQNWHIDISFSARFAMIEKIIISFQTTNDSFEHAEARAKGKGIEKDIYLTASSKEAYVEMCDAIIAANLDRATTTTVTEDIAETSLEEDNSNASALNIGTYEHATHYRDGLFSSVYRAKIVVPADQESAMTAKNGEVVALKITTPSSMAPPHDSKREARILELASSEHVITLIDAFQQSGGRFVIAMPFMPYDLEWLLKDSRVNATQAQSHLKDMFHALALLHSLGIIHRDVKPSNILLKSVHGPAYLADFGIAWAPDDASSEPAEEKITDVGTTSYRPPELLFGNTAYNCTLDLWAAGCVVAEVAGLSNRTLFDSGDLGSELALIQSVFKSLGTPTLEVWPEAAKFRDWGKMQFYEYPANPWSELLPGAPPAAQDLVSKLLRYESGERLSAAEALQHSYFAE